MTFPSRKTVVGPTWAKWLACSSHIVLLEVCLLANYGCGIMEIGNSDSNTLLWTLEHVPKRSHLFRNARVPVRAQSQPLVFGFFPICSQSRHHRYSTMLVRMLRAGSHGVPSLTYVSKSQHGGKVPTFEPRDTIQT